MAGTYIAGAGKVAVAMVTASVRQNEHVVASVSRSMSTDLPAANLGEVVSDALQEAWAEGIDPFGSVVVVTFR